MKISSALFLSLIFITAERTSEVEYKGLQKPISIVVKKFSPAFAALEDTFEVNVNPSKEIIKSFQTQTTNIKSGLPELKVVKLEGFKIKKQNSENLVSLTKKVATAAQNIVSQNLDLKNNNPKNIFDTSMDLNEVQLGAPRQVSLEQGALKSKNRIAKKIEVDGVAFEIGTPDDKSQEIASQNNETDQIDISGMIPNFLNLGKLSSANRNSEDNLSAYAGSAQPEKPIRAQVLEGQIELTGGAVYPGERFQFYIQRVFDGVVQERGEINSWTGEYSIIIKEPKGLISVELRHDSGALLALGQLPLSADSKKETTIKIFPSENSHHIGQVLSYESFEEFEVAVNDASQIYIDGEDSVDQTDERGRIGNTMSISPGSQMVVSASHKGYWNSLQITEAGQPIKTIMHSDKHMKSFLQLIEPYLKKANINTVIWGRITDRGRSMSNVKVSLHGFEDIQPLYFSYRIPDPSLEATSPDGFFAFVNPPEGLHIVKTNQPNMPLESVLVRMDHTSLVSLETAPKRNVNVYSYDAFGENQSIPAQISIPGTDKKWGVGGTKLASLPFFDTPTNMVMDVEPIDQDFYPTRFFIGRRRASVEIPHFRKSWLNSILASEKVNTSPRTTSIIGWIEKGSYNVNVYPRNENTRIIYFNKEGYVIESMMDGGGYIATNVPPGVITSTLRNNETSKLIKRLSISEPHRLSVNYINDLD